ncbi:hypothetical protein PN466_22920 [Roseofilum reptotaenium CS-1145]|uniref:Uncharacterized protein n=1 Tax=Roseofilum reptotaenium AO1-A TaxID=1925591 RepID=A0A1L9QMY3_9CYAN|nr:MULTISPECIES: hypothetical protein [Roseofilum]MBP0030463.1 hypothetical protein [Roseofilum sp. Guam]MDB9519801.1 hypothetical protein [Roseofilum reptotaenium CS-1145]OJJ24025.1 hypothetical protein BI308_18745 [Roseofilum reptotaenium AO1-A]
MLTSSSTSPEFNSSAEEFSFLERCRDLMALLELDETDKLEGNYSLEDFLYLQQAIREKLAQ